MEADLYLKPARPGRLRSLARLSMAAGLCALWLVTLSPTGLGGPLGMVWVSGTSMEPGLVSGDLVITYEQASYQVGDVVAFEIPGGGIVIHRVTVITDEGFYRFQGDNRRYEDTWDLRAEAIVGKSVVEIHKAFVIVYWLSQPISFAVMVGLLTAIYMFRTPRESAETVESGDGQLP